MRDEDGRPHPPARRPAAPLWARLRHRPH